MSLISLISLLALFCTPTVRGNAELRALIKLKASLDPESKILSTWTNEGDPCETFEGVACNEHRKVANISLQSKGLAGEISPVVGELKCLSGLYLHYNSLKGEIPREIGNLSELSDVYLDVNNLSGNIPPEIGDMASLQVLQLCCNQLMGNIPTNIGSLKKLNFLALQHNRLNGSIPASLGNLVVLKRLDLSYNQLSGPIPARLSTVQQLQVLDVQNNSLSGPVPSGLKRLNGRLHSENNPGLCGIGFASLRNCSSWDNQNTIQMEPFNFKPFANDTVPQSTCIHTHPNANSTQIRSSNTSKLVKIAIFSGGVALSFTLIISAILILIPQRRKKQKIGSTGDDASDDRLSTDQAKNFHPRTPSPLVSLEYSNKWDPMADCYDGCGNFNEFKPGFKFNIEDIESATQYFSKANLLGKSNFSAVYKGIMKDGSVVAIKGINVIFCKSSEDEFMKGLSLLTSLKHENLVKLRGFCCSKGRGECFLIYDFASKGKLSKYLDVGKWSSYVLDLPTRISIINGIAKGIAYLHSKDTDKPAMVHQNISVEKVLIDDKYNPLISDSGLLKLLAEDATFSALKVSAALGYMAPEYVTTGRFTEKSDIYAFGVIIIQILSGKSKLGNLMQLAAESSRLEDFIDKNLVGKFNYSEVGKLTDIALLCTSGDPEQRPSIGVVIDELNKVGLVVED